MNLKMMIGYKLRRIFQKILNKFGFGYCDFCGIRITRNKKTLYYLDDEGCVMPEGDYFVCSICEEG